jgi:hypothetical protein
MMKEKAQAEADLDKKITDEIDRMNQEYRKMIQSGWCPNCETYCYGDCSY